MTLHNNWYAENVRGRMPRVRYGHVHIYNNYYNSVGNGYCVGVGYECHIKIENTYFENINSAWADYGGTSNGEIGWDSLKFVDCSQPTFVSNSFPVFSAPYEYEMHTVEDVKAIVMANAGNAPITTSVGENDHAVPSEFKLFQNYPNPFNPSTTIRYHLKNRNYVSLKIYEMPGREIKTLVDQHQTAGDHSVTFDASNLVSGIYIYRLKVGSFKQSRKMLLMK